MALIDRFEKHLHVAWYDARKFLGGPADRQSDVEPLAEETTALFDAETLSVEDTLASERLGSPQVVSWQIPALGLYRLRECLLAGYAGNLYTTQHPRLYTCSRPLNPRAKVRLPIRWLSHAFAPLDSLCHFQGETLQNRAHFIAEQAPRLEVYLNHAGAATRGILTPPGPSRWLYDYLDAFGISASQVRPGSQGTRRATNLSYVPYTGPELISYPRSVYLSMCGRLQAWADDLGADGHKRRIVWITRRDAPRRRLLNERELCASLEHHWQAPELLELSGMNLEAQLRYLRDTDIIFAEQGQALNLLAFLRGKTVFMLESGPYRIAPAWNETFFTIGTLAGNRVARLFSETPVGENEDWTYPQERFVADVRQAMRFFGHE